MGIDKQTGYKIDSRSLFFLSSHRPRCPPQLKNRDTHHAHERSDRFVIHEWEGLSKVPPTWSRDDSGTNVPNGVHENRRLLLLSQRYRHELTWLCRSRTSMEGSGGALKYRRGLRVSLLVLMSTKSSRPSIAPVWASQQRFHLCFPLRGALVLPIGGRGGSRFGPDAVHQRVRPLVHFAVRVWRF